MLSFVELTRPSVSILAGSAVLVGALVAGMGFPFPLQFFIAFIVTILISSAGNVINDYYDYDIDKINKPLRPIPSGRVTRERAKRFSGLLFALGTILAVLYLNIWAILLVILNSILALFYSKHIKITSIGPFVDSWLAASTFLLGAVVISNVNLIVIVLFILAYLINAGREIVKAVEDYEGDKKVGARTFPVTYGKIRSVHAAIILTIAGILFSPVPYFLGAMGIGFLIPILTADAVFLYSYYLMEKDFKNAAQSQKFIKAGMYIAILGFLFGLL